MLNNLRSKIIHLAASMPKGRERTALLKVLASGPAPDGSNWKEFGSGNMQRWVWTEKSGVSFTVRWDKNFNGYKTLMMFDNGDIFESRAFTKDKETQFANAKILFDWYERYGKQQERVGDGQAGQDFNKGLAAVMPSHLEMRYSNPAYGAKTYDNGRRRD